MIGQSLIVARTQNERQLSGVGHELDLFFGVFRGTFFWYSPGPAERFFYRFSAPIRLDQSR